jgi:hypothetical protein
MFANVNATKSWRVLIGNVPEKDKTSPLFSLRAYYSFVSMYFPQLLIVKHFFNQKIWVTTNNGEEIFLPNVDGNSCF